jgi:aminoglycoside phosphotransferase (APT) family kinase protein
MVDTAVPTPLPGLDLPAVLTWLEGAAPGLFTGVPTAELIAGGRSNLTYVLDDGRRKVVLRRPPLGHVLATAHDMGREYRVLRGLFPTDVPVPEPIAISPDDAVNGAPFYLMAHVEGRILRNRNDLVDLDAEAKRRLSHSMMSVLARLHGLDPAAVGLSDHGRPEGYLERQVRRWSKQLDNSRGRELAGIDELRDMLASNIPVSGPPAIVHGDYRMDNLIVAGPGESDEFAVRAVLDWEMSTLGDPLADIGVLLAYWDVVSALDHPGVRSLGPKTGFPAGAELVEWYSAERGVSVPELPWYVAFGLFKIAVVLEGIHFRYGLGQTVGAGFDQIGNMVPPIVEAGLDTIVGRRAGR